MRTFKYTPPGEIDGDPFEVAAETRELCHRLAGEIEFLTIQVYQQLRNAALSEQLAAGAEEPSEASWEASEAGEKALQARSRAELFSRSLRAL